MNFSFRCNAILCWFPVLLLGCAGCSGCNSKLDIGGGNIEYSSDITESQARRLGSYLEKEQLMKGFSYRVELRDRCYLIRVSIKAGREEDVAAYFNQRNLGGRIAKEVFDDSPVDIGLCDGDFNIVRKIEFRRLKPEMPIRVGFRTSIGGGSLVAQFRNTSDRFILATAALRNATTGSHTTIRLEIRPGGLQEHGWLEGWSFMSGERILISNADYEDLLVVVP